MMLTVSAVEYPPKTVVPVASYNPLCVPGQRPAVRNRQPQLFPFSPRSCVALSLEARPGLCVRLCLWETVFIQSPTRKPSSPSSPPLPVAAGRPAAGFPSLPAWQASSRSQSAFPFPLYVIPPYILHHYVPRLIDVVSSMAIGIGC